MRKTLLQTLLAAFCTIPFALRSLGEGWVACAALEGGGVMLINLRNALMAGTRATPLILRMSEGIDVRSQVSLPDGNFTITFWAKCYSRAQGGIQSGYLYLFGWGDGGWGGTRMVFERSSFVVRYATGSSSTNYSVYTINSYASDAIWHFYSFRKNGTTLTASVDGSQILSSTVSRSHRADSLPLSIGGLGNDADIEWHRGDKSIGMFTLFSRALSDEETTALSMVRKIEPQNSLFQGLVCGYELSSSTKLSDAIGLHNLTAYNYSGENLEYTDPLPA